MMKRMKQAVSFFMAVCLLAGNSYTGGTKTEVSMTPFVQVSETATAEESALLQTGEDTSVLEALRNPFGKLSEMKYHEIRKASAEDEKGSYVLTSSGEKINDFEKITMVNDTITLSIRREDSAGVDLGIAVGDQIEVIVSGNDTVVKHVPVSGSNQSQTIVLQRVGAGYADVTIKITDANNALVRSFTCTILVEAILDKSDEQWENVGNNKVVLVLDQGEKYPLKFSNLANVAASQLQFEEPVTPGIIHVDSETGEITALGAGHTRFNIQNYAGIIKDDADTIKDTEEVEVIVLPIGSGDVNETVDQYRKDVSVTVPAVKYEQESRFTLYSNATRSDLLIWEVYSVNQAGDETLISEDDHTLLKYELVNNVINFTDVKAGTYRVRAYATKDYKVSNDLPCLTYDVIVDLSMGDETIYMNVGDTFDIMERANIPEGMYGKLFTNTVNDGSNATINPNTGVITANRKGTQVFTIMYRDSTELDDYGIYNGTFLEDDILNRTYTYTVKVIDTIVVNPSSLVLYAGGSYQLTPTSTHTSEPIYWECSEEDSQYIEVNENGLVKALEKTPEDYVAKAIAYQIIDGVKKVAVCYITVEASVTKIELEPNDVVLNIDETKTITAKITPTGLSGVKLTWTSSDDSIFEIVEEQRLYIQIKGKKAGTATLTAINDKNIVVGYCTVTVRDKATGITLSQNTITGRTDVKVQLYATVNPKDKVDQSVIWSSSDTSIVTVDDKGLVQLKKPGKAVIFVRSKAYPDMDPVLCQVTVEQGIGGLTIDLDSDFIEMYVGESKKIEYTVDPKNASNPGVTWTSFNESIVSVDANGKLTAKTPGTTQVMVMSEEDPSYFEIVKVVVKQQATSVRMNYTTVTMNRGEYFDMEVTITPATSTETNLTWESLDPTVVTVSTTGRFTGRAAGTAVVIVRTPNGVTSYCTVTVVEPVTSLELDPSEVTIDVGEKFTIAPVFKPENPTNIDVEWTSSNPNIATINAAGELEGQARGTAVIICETVDGGFRAFCLVTVVDPELELIIDPETYRLGYGKSYTLTAILKSHGEEQEADVEWSSSNSSVCTIDKNGKIKGVNYGYATITATTNDEYEVKATCEVRVVREVTSIKLNHSYVEVIQGQTVDLRATVNPSNATYQDVIFSSDNSDIAFVDEDGIITGLQPGETKIIANAKDNSGKTATCYVKVIAPIAATGVTVSDKQIVLVPGEKKQITTSMKPNNTTDDQMWSSNNDYIATVDSTGTITAHTTGTATVTVMTSSGKMATVDVIVLGLSRTTLEMPVYTQYSRLTVDGATTTVRWDVQDTSICEVNNGVITARKVGTTKVTATINGRTLSCTVKVISNKKK